MEHSPTPLPAPDASAIPAKMPPAVGGVMPVLRPGATKRFLRLLLLLLAGVVFCNVLVGVAARSSQRQQMLARLSALNGPVDCIMLGNSLMEAGVDPKLMEEAWPVPGSPPSVVNLALGATSPVEHALILKRALAQPIHPRLIVYGFFDDQLFSQTSGDWGDLVGNRAFSCYFPREAADLYAPGSWLKRWQLQFTAWIPMLVERSSLWGKVDEIRRAMEGVGMPPQKMNRFGRVGDFNALEAKDGPAFEARLRGTLSGAGGFSRPVSEIIDLARLHHARLVFLEMPMPSHHRTVFYTSEAWVTLRQRIQTLSAAEGIVYLSASDWIRNDAQFEDATHLSSQGAVEFSRKLAVALRPILAGNAGTVAMKSR